MRQDETRIRLQDPLAVKGRATINNINERQEARPLGYRPVRHLSNYLYIRHVQPTHRFTRPKMKTSLFVELNCRSFDTR